MRARTIATILVCAVTLPDDGPPAAQARSAKTWVGRHQEIEEYLRTAECVSMKWFAPNRAARCTLRPGGPIAALAWRPLLPGPSGGRRQGFREDYQAEIAAYELDKLFTMDMVPPTVERQIQGTKGNAQQWVEGVVDVTDPARPEGKERLQWERDVLRMTMFDMLIGNQERNRRNMLRDDVWNLILIDHSRAFRTDVDRVGKLTAVDRAFWTKIEALTRTQLDKSLGGWLDQDQIAAILSRRDLMRADVNSLAR